MATFYLLPPRACLEQTFADVLGRLLPGVPLPEQSWDLFLLHLAANSGWSRELHIVSRDDLPDGEPVDGALREHFGAEPGDRVVDVPPARVSFTNPAPARAWTLGPVGVPAPSAGSYNSPTLTTSSLDIASLV